MNSIQNKIDKIEIDGYELSFEKTFEYAWSNYKKTAVYAGLILLVFISLFVALLFALLIYSYDFDSIMKNLRLMSEGPSGISSDFIIGYYAVVILISCLLSPFQAGFLKMADCGQKGEEFHVSSIFEYYKTPYIGSILWATLLITTSSTGLTILLETNNIQFIGTLVSFGISFLTFLTIPLVVFGKLEPLEAIKSSAIIMSKKPLILLGLLIVSGLFSIVGVVGCGIGVVFTIPFLYSMTYTLYVTIIGLDPNEKTENLKKSNE